VQELHGGEAPPNVPSTNVPTTNGPTTNGPTTNVMASSPSVVADLTDEHYLDARELESLFQA
jgi:hypothetical protein